MTRIFLDQVLREKLKDLNEPIELCDASGRVLGMLFPAIDPADYEPDGPQVSEEELDRRERSNERRYSTAEVLAHLEKL